MKNYRLQERNWKELPQFPGVFVTDTFENVRKSGLLIVDPKNAGIEAGLLERNTEEKKLSDLGVFPLPDEEQHWLEIEAITDEGPLRIPGILKKSHIPVFLGAAGNAKAWLSPPALNICRYFAQVWAGPPGDLKEQENFSESEKEIREILKGFYILFEFCGEPQ